MARRAPLHWRRLLGLAALLGVLCMFPSTVHAQAEQPVAAVPVFGDLPQAQQWLESNRLHPAFFQAADRAVGLAPSLDEAVAFLEGLARSAPDMPARSRLWLRAGVLAERGNQFDTALSLFEQSMAADPTLFDARLGAVRSAMELGYTQRALTMATDVINGAPTLALQRQAAIIRARALWFAGRTDVALRHLGALNAADDPRVLSPTALLLEYEVARAAGDDVRQQRALGQLTRHFANAPETMVARGQAHFTPNPAQLLPQIGVRTAPGAAASTPTVSTPTVSTPTVSTPTVSTPTVSTPVAERADPAPRTTPATPSAPASAASTPTGAAAAATSAVTTAAARQPTGLQTGSFRDPENATYMVEDLRRLGFDARVADVTVADGSVFFRVVVPIAHADDVQRVVAQLKEQGIEGLLLF